LICGSKAQNRNWRKSGGDEKLHLVPLHTASPLAMTCHRLNPVEEDLTGIASLCYKLLNPGPFGCSATVGWAAGSAEVPIGSLC
jgi:hypothetical protein